MSNETKARKRRDAIEIFSVFGQIECVAAEIMIERGEAKRIDASEIPLSVAFNDQGATARFAVMMSKNLVPRFNKLIADLRS